jgi:uroporphyrinogen decarboxylase
MRQAGRYLPEYREVRADAGGFLEMVRSPELSAEVTLQPIRRFGMDAAIVFSDILLPLEAMGMELIFDERGPHFPRPLRTLEQVQELTLPAPKEALAYVGETLKLVRNGLPDETALIGFCGAPFTLASYAIEGGTSRTFLNLRHAMYHREEMWTRLMGDLATMVAAHLRFQIESGAEAVVLFDTWAASLTREDYQRFAAPWSRRVLAEVEGLAPRIVFGGAADHLVEDLADLGAEAVSIDHRTDIARAFERIGDRVALQGNLDPGVLLSDPHEVERRTRELIESAGDRAGHVVNLGHGVFKTTDPDCVAAFVDTAQEARCALKS